MIDLGQAICSTMHASKECLPIVHRRLTFNQVLKPIWDLFCDAPVIILPCSLCPLIFRNIPTSNLFTIPQYSL